MPRPGSSVQQRSGGERAAISSVDATRAVRSQAADGLAHLIAIADGEQAHDFAAVGGVLAARGDRLP